MSINYQDSYAEKLVSNNMSGGFPMTELIIQGEKNEHSNFKGGYSRNGKNEFSIFNNLVIPIGLDSHSNANVPFLDKINTYTKEIKVVENELFDTLLGKVEKSSK